MQRDDTPTRGSSRYKRDLRSRLREDSLAIQRLMIRALPQGDEIGILLRPFREVWGEPERFTQCIHRLLGLARKCIAAGEVVAHDAAPVGAIVQLRQPVRRLFREFGATADLACSA